jgi:LPS export ABC transporter permease LptG/LPS export ABC transporter permease LptF
MRILTRYILGEILSHTLIGCALFTFILLMKELPNILNLVVRNSSTFSSVLEVVLFLLPNFFMVTVPMAVLVGVLLGFSRMAADSEIVAMRASGLGIGYFVRVAAIVAVGGTVLGLANSLFVAPRANQGILDLDKLLASQATYEIQPRVFYEDFRDKVLYVQNVVAARGAANWRQVFMADITDPTLPKITTAASATVVSDSTQELMMRLRNGTENDPVPEHPEQSNISTFAIDDLPFTVSQQNEGHLGRLDTAIYAMPLKEVAVRTHGPDGRRFSIELNKRFAYPFACLVLMLVGVPLGVTSKRGGKSSAWVFTILLVVLYYSLSLIGIALGRQNWLPTFLAVWSANILFALFGAFLLWQMASGGAVLATIAGWTAQEGTPRLADTAITVGSSLGTWLGRQLRRSIAAFRSMFPESSKRKVARGAFPRILDSYVVLEFLNMFGLILVGFVLLMLVFTVFDRLSDILRNHIAFTVVGAYLINVTPYFLYQLAPLAVLIAVLVTFGVLNRNSEFTAMKATGISLYRLVTPVISISAILAVSLFLFDEFYLPQANKKQDALLNVIKGKPPQTVTHPEQNWIFGQPGKGEPGRIFYYRFFDPDRNEFANISVFEFNPATFALTRRIFAAKAVWDDEAGSWSFQNGWENDIEGDHPTHFQQFQRMSFSEIHEDPVYFNKESLQAQQMNFEQLDRYIADLRQSGLDTMKLRVALWHKLAYPLVAVVMAVLAIPFALSMGRRGSLTGVAVAIGVALTYFVVENLFGALGNVNYLPAALAAWSSDVLFARVGGYLLLRTPT